MVLRVLVLALGFPFLLARQGDHELDKRSKLLRGYPVPPSVTNLSAIQEPSNRLVTGGARGLHEALIQHRSFEIPTKTARTQTQSGTGVRRAAALPTSAPVGIPSGPFIYATSANEVVVIPDPPRPSFPSRSSCPHLDNDLLDWHKPSTWGGPIPKAGTNVTLPTNSRVVVRRPVVGKLSFVNIPASSELIFGENITGITFDVSGIAVKGKLTAGSETCRIRTPVTITLHGARPNSAVTNVPPPEYKGISVTGEISIHGQRFFRIWTRLALTINPGGSVLMLQHGVNWEPGQKIVLVTTAMKDSREWHRNEVASVKKVILSPRTGVGAAVFLEKPVLYQHIANSGYQGEVGLLTRTVKIQGSQTSEPTDPDPLNCVQSSSNYGDAAKPCPNKSLTGYGGHIIVHQGGKGYVEGVELYRMGQTNVMGRYPMHFHLLGESCSDCYFRDSSVHRSFYRCISVHATHFIEVSENVAYDVSGYCFYLEDGIEHDNRIEYNLGAHIHIIGPDPAKGTGLITSLYTPSSSLNFPADVTASAFYITNVHNFIIGNAASGGWAGFAFPNLLTPTGLSRDVNLRPSSVRELVIDGNTAHSTGWWWNRAAAFYFGGSLYYNAEGILEYQAGRDLNNQRSTCLLDKCQSSAGCGSFCTQWQQAWMRVSNNKAFLTPSIGLNSWGGRLDVVGFECHDCGLCMQAQATDGFSAHDVLVACRSRTPIVLPSSASASKIPAVGFSWYDTNQEHIIYDITFRNCGYRSASYAQYDQGLTRGCGDERDIGCDPNSSVWSMEAFSDQNVPEVMHATRGVKFEKCGRRFRMHDFRPISLPNSNSGRLQNWYDIDGSVTGLGERSVIASGFADAGMWWKVDDEVVFDQQGPLWFFKLDSGPQRGLGSVTMKWDSTLDAQVGVSHCGNGNSFPCDAVGRIKHLGGKYKNDAGLPVTANAQIVGPVGGFGWKLQLYKGAPKSIRFSEIEVDPATPMLLSIAYPPGTKFTITASSSYCKPSVQYTCQDTFRQVASVAAVRKSIGNTYHVSTNGVLTLRLIQTPKTFVGRPDFFLPKYTDEGRDGNGVALERFERDGIRLLCSQMVTRCW
ncbi:hypothetical protein MHU86_21310 [Fragilaria crotonensis]|nr:hypothetical protein MHU86_21310 [Fragilaria crotonensis]